MDVLVSDPPTADRSSFQAWADARAGALLRFAYLVCGSRAEAEDALQSALERACTQWRRISAADDPERYVRRMIANAHVSLWRRHRRESPVEAVRLAETADPAEAVTTSEALWQVCRSLPRQQRAAVVLRYYEDREYAEIAELLGCSEITARTHVHRAIAAMRARLDGAEES